MQPNDDGRRRALKRAEEMEAGLEQLQQAERDTVELLEKLDKLAADLFDHASEWEPVNPQIASRVRQQEQQVRALRNRVEHLGVLEADEAEKIMAAVRVELRRVRGEG